MIDDRAPSGIDGVVTDSHEGDAEHSRGQLAIQAHGGLLETVIGVGNCEFISMYESDIIYKTTRMLQN